MCDNFVKKRSPNWTLSEKSLLLNIISDRFSIVENKRTDSVSVREKLAEWLKISDLYNAQTNQRHRTAENIKAQWDSMRKNIRRKAFSVGTNQIQTDSGTSKDPISKILNLILHSAVGLHDPVDADSSYQEINDDETMTDTQTTAECTDTFDNEVRVEENSHSVDSNDYTHTVPRPIKLETHNEEEENKESRSIPQFSQLRPIHPAMASLQLLHKKKIEAMKTQFQKAKDQEESKQLNSFRIEANELELEMKREMLKQEKIKTKILLLELRLKRKQCENV